MIVTNGRAAVTTRRANHLLNGGSAMVGLGLTSGRAAAAMYKVQQNLPFDEIDSASLSEIDQLLRSSADTVRFFSSRGQAGTPPTDALSIEVEMTIYVVAHDPIAVDIGPLEDRLTQISSWIQAVIDTRQVDIANRLSEYFVRLSRSALHETASVGETAGRL